VAGPAGFTACARASRALRRSTCCRPRAACADRSGGPQEPRRGPQRPVKTPSQGNSGRREVTGTRRVVGEDGGVVECAEVAFTAPGLMVADVAAAVLHFAVARGSPGAQKAQIWRPFASPQKQAKPAQIGGYARARGLVSTHSPCSGCSSSPAGASPHSPAAGSSYSEGGNSSY